MCRGAIILFRMGTPVTTEHRRPKSFSFIIKDLASGTINALCANMKKTYLIAMISILLWPMCVKGDEQKPAANVNERYVVESVEIAGKDASKVSKVLSDDAQKLAGQKYSEKSANDIAARIRNELGESHGVDLRVEKGTKPETVKVVFKIVRAWSISAESWIGGTYHSKEGFNGYVKFGMPYKSSSFSIGMTSSSDYFLERYTGYTLGYENKKLGTNRVHLKLDFETYHQSFNAATHTALEQRPDVPGIYRARQNFAPSISVDVAKNLTISIGLSFQRLQFQFPSLHTETAYAGTANIQYHPTLPSFSGYDQKLNAAYDLRTATRVLDSDFVYTRHLLSATYTLSKKKSALYATVLTGFTSRNSPLFERIQIGNSYALRGWNKFDVAPLGGTRVAYGSLEYWNRSFFTYYDVGSVWDSKQSSGVKHSLGFGYAPKWFGAFSLAFPVRLNHVEPVLIIQFPIGHFWGEATNP
jgi:hypothetical protein